MFYLINDYKYIKSKQDCYMNICSYFSIKFLVMYEGPDTTEIEEVAYTLKAILTAQG